MAAASRPSPVVLRLALAAAVLLLGDLAVQASRAQETAQAGNSSAAYRASAQALYWPTNFAVAEVAATMAAQATWNLASPEKGTGYAVLGYHSGRVAGVACPTTPSSYAYAASAANGSTTLADAASAYVAGTAAAYEGSYSCFAIQQWYTPGIAQGSWSASTSPAWTSTGNPATALAAGAYTTAAGFPNGMFVSSFSMTGGNGTIASGDTLVLNYTYSTNAPAVGTLRLCSDPATGTVYVGQNLSSSTCDSSGGTSFGTLAGGSFSSFKSRAGVYALTGAWSSSNRTLTLSVGSLVAGSQATSMTAGPWTFTPSQAAEAGQPLVTQATGHRVCNAPNTASAACRPSLSGSF